MELKKASNFVMKEGDVMTETSDLKFIEVLMGATIDFDPDTSDESDD